MERAQVERYSGAQRATEESGLAVNRSAKIRSGRGRCGADYFDGSLVSAWVATCCALLAVSFPFDGFVAGFNSWSVSAGFGDSFWAACSAALMAEANR